MVSVKQSLSMVALLLAAVTVAGVSAEQTPMAVNAVQLTGLPGVKENAKGKLSVENGNLHFMCGKKSSDVSASSIQEVVTGSDSQRAVGKTIGTISMAAPYGGGRVVSLFRKKLDTLSVEFRDADGGLHGAIFTIPSGKAEGFKTELIASGAHTKAATVAADGAITAQPSSSSVPTEKKQ